MDLLHYFNADYITSVFSGFSGNQSGKLEIGRKYQYYNILMTAFSRETRSKDHFFTEIENGFKGSFSTSTVTPDGRLAL